VRSPLWRGDIVAALASILDHAATDDVPHHARVAAIAARMASHLRSVDRLDVFYAGLLHDIGLMGSSRDPDRWINPDQQANLPMLRSHPLIGAQLVAQVPDLVTVAELIMDHHECVNGHGYPRGKVGDEISSGAQVLHFANVCDMVLREQGSPELIPLLDAVRRRTAPQVSTPVADAGIETLGEPGFYAQLLAADDVRFLVSSIVHRLAADDLITTEGQVTSLLELFAHVTDAHPADKIGHSRRVATLAVLVAMAMRLGKDVSTNVKWAGLVHDVGMVTVPKEILDKAGPLTPGELAEVRRHALATGRFIGTIRGLEEIAKVAASHGEAYDGSGYPHGLSGNEIPIEARILAVCDTFDALTSRRPYRDARETTLAIDILVKGSGSLFDPDVVDAAVPAFLVARSAEEPLAALANSN
jgi:HD-GYP domain-containing protein (c-di-GMP phosphodiesterase class II)